MGAPVFLNGRFLSQKVTGVQRYAQEVSAAIGVLSGRGEFPETEVLVPPPSAAVNGAGLPGLRLRSVGRTRGHVWEQTELPLAARDGVLLGLGNTGPILSGRRQVVVIHDAGVFDVPDSYSLPFRSWYRSLQYGLVRRGASIVTVSDFSRARIAARLGIDPATIAVTHEAGSHILRVAPDPGTLARYGLQPGRFALAVGARMGHKNLDALRRLSAELAGRNMVLAVVGAIGPVAFAAADGHGAAVGRALGRVTDAELRCLYETASCLVSPSRYEGFGLPPIEALSCGCPVIAAGGGAVEEVCGTAALYCDPAAPGAIPDLCRRLLDDPDLACDLRARGPERAGAFSWEGAARVLAGVVAQVQREMGLTTNTGPGGPRFSRAL